MQNKISNRWKELIFFPLVVGIILLVIQDVFCNDYSKCKGDIMSVIDRDVSVNYLKNKYGQPMESNFTSIEKESMQFIWRDDDLFFSVMTSPKRKDGDFEVEEMSFTINKKGDCVFKIDNILKEAYPNLPDFGLMTFEDIFREIPTESINYYADDYVSGEFICAIIVEIEMPDSQVGELKQYIFSTEDIIGGYEDIVNGNPSDREMLKRIIKYQFNKKITRIRIKYSAPGYDL